MQFNWIDTVVLVVYMVGITWLGIYQAREDQEYRRLLCRGPGIQQVLDDDALARHRNARR